MGKLYFEMNDLNKKVVDAYLSTQGLKHLPITTQPLGESICFEENPLQGWLATFGITHKKGVIDGLEIPEGSLYDKYPEFIAINPDESAKELTTKCSFYNGIYSICVEYINGKKNNLFAPNLDNISHAKSLAIILLAQMCVNGMKTANKEKDDKHRERIKNYVENLIKHREITDGTSNDDNGITCATALTKIKEQLQPDFKQDAVQTNQIKEFYNNVDKTLEAVEKTVQHINLYTFPVITGLNKSYLDVEPLLKDQNYRTELGLQASLVKEIYGVPLQQAEGYLQLYNGHAYNLSENKDQSYLLKKMSAEQLDNIKNLLQLRDRLHILWQTTTKLMKFARDNEDSRVHECIKMIDPALKEILTTKTALIDALAIFSADCRDVWYKAKKNKGIFYTTDDESWVKIYITRLNRDGLVRVLNEIIANLTKVFATIPLNFTSTIDSLRTEAKEITDQFDALFKQNKKNTISFQTEIDQLQVKELKRQYHLLTEAQEKLIDDYTALIEKVSQDYPDQKDLLSLLKGNRKAIEMQQINAANSTVMSLPQVDDLETSFVWVESSAEGVNDEYNRGIISFVTNYLTGNQEKTQDFQNLKAELEILQKNNQTLVRNNEELTLKNESLEEQNKTLLDTCGIKEQQISKLTTEKESLKNEGEKKDKTIALIKQINGLPDAKSINSLIAVQPETKVKLFSVATNNADKEEQLSSMINNIIDDAKDLISEMNKLAKSYIEQSGQKDRTRFFPLVTHNKNGFNHAEKLAMQFNEIINDSLNKQLKEINLDEAPDKLRTNLREQALRVLAVMLKDETYSGYRQYSFRHYLLQFEKELLNSYTSKTELKELAKNAITNVDRNSQFNGKYYTDAVRETFSTVSGFSR